MILKILYKNKHLQLSFGLLFGIIFGVLLDIGGVTDYNILINQLLLKDFRVAKIILSAIFVGMICIEILRQMGVINTHPKPLNFRANIIGGLIFGVGFALLGYCPGTTLGAAGGGSIHAIFGFFGMLIGTWIFALIYPYIKRFIEKGNLGVVTLEKVAHLSKIIVILIIALLILTALYYMENTGL